PPPPLPPPQTLLGVTRGRCGTPTVTGGGGGGFRTPPDRLGSTQCRRCLITFPDAAFAARHAKREHPRDFVAAALRGAQFVCFVCARPFASSRALLRHQRGH
uniref:C2H2-type domain-containing protein n=1 Tax=Anas platyrhynchos platyrhynchos TaxID=8840 RepID=A0A493TRE3_ANAPP